MNGAACHTRTVQPPRISRLAGAATVSSPHYTARNMSIPEFISYPFPSGRWWSLHCVWKKK